MKNFLIGFIFCNVLWFIMLSLVTIPDYTLQIDCKDPTLHTNKKPGYI